MVTKVNRYWSKKGNGQLAYETRLGKAYNGTIEMFLDSPEAKDLRGKVKLLFTSPPFPLASPKAYGNPVGDEYINWIVGLAPRLSDLLTEKGSLVLEIGNAWVKGSPIMSTVPLETLIQFGRIGKLNVCQQFVCNNPARLPTPIVWVNKERIRVKDSFTHVWWYSKSPFPTADNRNVLRPYSAAMLKLLARGSYNSGKRPSDHQVGERSFLTNNGGSIPSNMLEFSGTAVDRRYKQWCKENGLKQHPAKMAEGLVEFFVKMLTRKGDLVLDPFAGSNTTGAVAERLERRWLAIEPNPEYLTGSLGRFTS